MSRTIFNLLRADGGIIINKNLARNIGIDQPVIYFELISKYTYYKERNMLTEDGFFLGVSPDQPSIQTICWPTLKG